MNLLELPFDQYQRYRAVADLLAALPGGPPAHVLEVGGGGESHLAAFLPGTRVTVADVELRGVIPPGVTAVRADACRPLPFRDASVPAALTVDTLEHLPAAARPAVVRELRRVAAGPIVLASPILTPATAAAELALSVCYRLLFGVEHRWLAEHRLMGLPAVADIDAVVMELGGALRRDWNGYLPDWQALMLLHLLFDEVATPDTPALRALDAHYNAELYRFGNRPPAYRMIWTHARRDADLPAVRLVADGEPPEAARIAFARMADELAAALPAVHAEIAGAELRRLRFRIADALAEQEHLNAELRRVDLARLEALGEGERLRADRDRALGEGERLCADRDRLEVEYARLQASHDQLSHSWLWMEADRRRMEDERNAATAVVGELRWRLGRLRLADRALDTVVPAVRRVLAPLRRHAAEPSANGAGAPAEAEAPPRAPVAIIVLDPDGDPARLARTRASLEAQHLPPVAVHEARTPLDGAWLTDDYPGTHLALLIAGDRLAPAALADITEALGRRLDATVVFGDEDEWPPEGRRQHPVRKLPWDPELARAASYLGALACFRRELLARVPARATPAEALYALTLAVAEHDEARAVHLPVVLCHTDPATAPLRRLDPAAEPARRLLAEHLQRTADRGDVIPAGPGFAIRRPVDPGLRASIIIPFRDRPELLARCVASVRACTTHPSWELLLVDNCSSEAATERLLESLVAADPERVRVLRFRHHFNFSAINNFAASEARGDVLVLLNNDTEIVTREWLTILLGLATRPHVGAVGPLLLFPDGRIQHCGIALGMGEWPGRPHGVAGLMLSGCRPETSDPLLHAYDRRTAAVTAACLAIRRDRYFDVGVRGMDEQLHTDFNDVDLCLKLAARGFHTLYTPHVRVVHHESVSRGGRPVDPRGVDLMYARWGDHLAYDPYCGAHVDRVGRPPAAGLQPMGSVRVPNG